MVILQNMDVSFSPNILKRGSVLKVFVKNTPGAASGGALRASLCPKEGVLFSKNIENTCFQKQMEREQIIYIYMYAYIYIYIISICIYIGSRGEELEQQQVSGQGRQALVARRVLRALVPPPTPCSHRVLA